MVAFLSNSHGHEAVVVARLGVLEDIGEAAKVRRPKQMRDVFHRLLSEQRQRRRVDLEDGLPVEESSSTKSPSRRRYGCRQP